MSYRKETITYHYRFAKHWKEATENKYEIQQKGMKYTLFEDLLVYLTVDQHFALQCKIFYNLQNTSPTKQKQNKHKT